MRTLITFVAALVSLFESALAAPATDPAIGKETHYTRSLKTNDTGFGWRDDSHLQVNAPVSVKWYGAQGNGVTDDTAAIQAAVNFATTNHLGIYFPGAVYAIAGTVTVPPRNHGTDTAGSWVFDGGGSVFLATGTQTNVFYFQSGPYPRDSWNYQIQNMRFGGLIKGAYIYIDGSRAWKWSIKRIRADWGSYPQADSLIQFHQFYSGGGAHRIEDLYCLGLVTNVLKFGREAGCNNFDDMTINGVLQDYVNTNGLAWAINTATNTSIDHSTIRGVECLQWCNAITGNLNDTIVENVYMEVGHDPIYGFQGSAIFTTFKNVCCYNYENPTAATNLLADGSFVKCTFNQFSAQQYDGSEKTNVWIRTDAASEWNRFDQVGKPNYTLSLAGDNYSTWHSYTNNIVLGNDGQAKFGPNVEFLADGQKTELQWQVGAEPWGTRLWSVLNGSTDVMAATSDGKLVVHDLQTVGLFNTTTNFADAQGLGNQTYSFLRIQGLESGYAGVIANPDDETYADGLLVKIANASQYSRIFTATGPGGDELWVSPDGSGLHLRTLLNTPSISSTSITNSGNLFSQMAYLTKDGSALILSPAVSNNASLLTFQDSVVGSARGSFGFASNGDTNMVVNVNNGLLDLKSPLGTRIQQASSTNWIQFLGISVDAGVTNFNVSVGGTNYHIGAAAY